MFTKKITIEIKKDPKDNAKIFTFKLENVSDKELLGAKIAIEKLLQQRREAVIESFKQGVFIEDENN